MNDANLKTVGEWVAERPSRSRIFEKKGIDYRCGGKRSFRAAALEAGCDPDALLAELDAQAIEEGDRDWRHARDQAGLAEA